MGFDTFISDGVVKIRAATLLGDIFCLHQRTKNMLKYFHTKSKYRHIVAIPYSDTQNSFSRAVRDKGSVDKIILHFSVRKEENKLAIEKYLSKHFFEKYEDEVIFAASQFGLPVSTSMKPE